MFSSSTSRSCMLIPAVGTCPAIFAERLLDLMHTTMLTLQISRVLKAEVVIANVFYFNSRNGWKLASQFSSNSSFRSEEERFGPNGIQMLSKHLYKQIFGKTAGQQWNTACIERSCKELEHHGLEGKKVPLLEDVKLDLPSLHGDNIDDHFRWIANQQLEPYMKLINEMIAVKLPPTPTQWSMMEGWTCYEHDGSCTHLAYPSEECLVLDVEVCVQEGPAPTLAVAVSPTHWYSWVSHRLASGQEGGQHKSWGWPDELISLAGFPQKAGLVIGHNVCYDRARIKEQYDIINSNVRFLDTLSLHTCVAGQTADQKLLWKRHFGEHSWETENDYSKQRWYHVSSPADLASVCWLHCGKIIDKSKRDLFVTEDMNVIRSHFQELMQYCCNDVHCTHELLCSLFPQFQEHCPHPVTLAGMLEMGSAYLPVDNQWDKYVHNCDEVYEDILREIKERLMGLADEAVKHQQHDRYKKDIWLANLDWTVKKRARHMRGYPDWYRKLCPKLSDDNDKPSPVLLTAQMRVSPYLLRMTWNGHPLFHHKTKKWGYLALQQDSSVANTGSDEDTEIDPAQYLENLPSLVKEEHDGYGEEQVEYGDAQGPPDDELILESINQKALFYRLPHKDGPTNNVGNPLSRNFLTKMDDGTLCSQSGEDGRRILMLNSMISFWRSSHDRIKDQFVVWLESESNQSDKRIGCILPQLIPAGTVTRRAVESTWLTASNPKDNRVGSELKSLVRAPSGYHLVGADVDSQELWIASVIGDAHFAGMHGSTAVGWMTLQGKKSEGTDLHSKTANTIGITRDQAKVFNYGRIYGAGKPFAIQLLKQFNSKIGDDEAEEKANTLYAATKGIRRYVLHHRGLQLAEEYGISIADDSSIDWKQYRDLKEMLLGDRNKKYKYMPRVIKQSYWSDGSESHMFNKLEQIATSPDPATPVLGCKITRALKPKYVGTQYMTSRINWVVQSSAVDYLHLMLVCMRWLISSYQVNARFCISIHDEVRYVVQSEDKYRTALALQITNLLTRSMFSFKLGINDLPQAVAFFSAVDIDKVLRKEVTMDCHTPSNPLGLEKSQGIPQGEALDVYQLIKLTGGKLKK